MTAIFSAFPLPAAFFGMMDIGIDPSKDPLFSFLGFFLGCPAQFTAGGFCRNHARSHRIDTDFLIPKVSCKAVNKRFNRLLLAAVTTENIKIHCVQLRIDHGNLVICQNDIARFKVLFQTFNLA